MCNTFEKSKKEYFNLNEKNVCDNKKFWKVVKTLSTKIISNEKIGLLWVIKF